MYLITKKSTETGKKFETVANKSKVVLEAQKALSKEIGFSQWRDGYWLVWGGFSALIFKTPPDSKVFKKVNGNEFMPKLNTKEGKVIQAKLDASPRITIEELNQCIGYNGSPFHTIGFAQKNKKYFGFVVGDDWGVKIPKDCEEVTVTKYNQLFK